MNFVKIIDKSTALPFNGDAPYIHWFDGPRSTGLIHHHRIDFIGGANPVSVEIPALLSEQANINKNIFALIDVKNIKGEQLSFDWDSWQDNEEQCALKKRVNTIVNDVGSIHIHSIYVAARSDIEGEFIEDIAIQGVRYKIGCSFYAMDESLKINLSNMGTDLSEAIVRALYTSDLYEDNPDWILYNRKVRELLMNFMDLLGSKGSYKQLEQSLKWFDYDRLVELREVWQYQTPDGTKYMDRPVSQWLTEELTNQLSNTKKSTYFALRSLMRTNPKRTDDPIKPDTTVEFTDTVYEKDEWDDKVVEDLACIWSENELRLKMVLLGNFFEQYFMPIHLDLIRSVVEDIYVENKDHGWTADDTAYDEVYTESNDFELEWDNGDPDPDNPGDSGVESRIKLHLDEVHVVAGLNLPDPFALAFGSNNSHMKTTANGETYVPIVACILQPGISYESKNWINQNFNGIGAVASGTFSFHIKDIDGNIIDSPKIVAGTLTTNSYGEEMVRSFSIPEAQAKSEFKMNFLFPYQGTYTMILNFEDTKGKHYTKRVKVIVDDNVTPKILFKKVMSIRNRGEELPNPWPMIESSNSQPDTPDNLWFNFQFTRTRDLQFIATPNGPIEYDGEYIYRQYIPLRRNRTEDKPLNAGGTVHVWTVLYNKDTLEKPTTFLGVDTVRTMMHNLIANECWYRESSKYAEETSSSQARDYYWVQFISKKHEGMPECIAKLKDLPKGCKVIERDVFIPQLVWLVDAVGDVDSQYPIICQPVLEIHLKDGNKYLPYSHDLVNKDITETMWEFWSWARQKDIAESLRNIKDPFMAPSNNEPIPLGYYRISFKYRLGNEVKTITQQSPFRLC